MIERNEEVVVGQGCNGYQDPNFAQAAYAAAQACGFGSGGGCAKTVIGSPVGTIASATTGTVTITIKMRRAGGFQGSRLVIPAETAAAVRVTRVLCGANDILPTEDPIAGETFSSVNELGGYLPFLPVMNNDTIKIELYNETAAAISVNPAIEGTPV